ncbi:hypothetical protein B0H14DRAFT_2692104 [Mycena olivaceomarginata]|nr:hypothetical protein B0H14DRAFT_2692104 [Mycena olivaceomarginata]
MTTAFRKVADDEWTSAGVKSTFAIDIPNNPASSVPPTVSPICGFGWRFHCSIGAESSTTAPRLLGANSEYIPWRRVELIFEPNRIQSASYGRLTFHTSIENLRPLDTEPCDNHCDIPLNYDNQVTIGVYMRLGDAGGGAPRSLGARKGNQAVDILEAQYRHPTTTLGPAKITIVTEFPADIGLTLPLPRDPRVDAALVATIRGEDTVDVKFYVYTRRGVDPLGASLVAQPRPLFAKLSLLRGHSDDLDTYLWGISGIAGFAESRMVDLEVDDPPKEFDNYDYMSDSDLDSDDEYDSVATPARSRMHSPEFAPSCRPTTDSHATPARSPLRTPPPEFLVPLPLIRPAGRRMGHMVVVKGHAFKTWHALLVYLYTKKIEFQTCKSFGPPENSLSKTPRCSAKSMYKLADRFGLDDLKTLAIASNIVRETFSTFTSL